MEDGRCVIIKERLISMHAYEQKYNNVIICAIIPNLAS